MPLSIVFAGSPAAAVPSLAALLDGPHEVVAVVTREDAPLGRKRVLTPTPVAQRATEAGVPVIKANRLATVSDELIALGADLGVVVAYGGLVREPLLSAPRLGWINVHFSLLPRWRGAAPVQHALIAGDTETGVSVFQLVPELDAGDVLASRSRPIGALENAGRLLDALAIDGADVLAEVVDALDAGTATALPQRGEVTLAPKLSLDDARIDWRDAPQATIDRIRGVTPEPGAHFEHEGARVKILDAAVAHEAPALPAGGIALAGGRLLVGTGSGESRGAVELVLVHPAGKRPMPAADWWRGASRASGARA